MPSSVPNSPDSGLPSPKKPTELPPPDAPTSTEMPPKPIDDSNEQAAENKQSNRNSRTGDDGIHLSFSGNISHQAAEDEPANPNSMKADDGIRYSISGSTDQPTDVTVFKSVVNDRGEVTRLYTAATKKEKIKQTDSIGSKYPTRLKLNVGIGYNGEFELTLDVKPTRDAKDTTPSDSQVGKTTDEPQCQRKSHGKARSTKKSVAVDETPLEDLERFGTPPNLPPNTVDIDLPSALDHMRAVDVYLRESQTRLEKLRMRIQRNNCNNNPHEEPEIANQKEDHDIQADNAAVDDNNQDLHKKQGIANQKENSEIQADNDAVDDNNPGGDEKDKPEAGATDKGWEKPDGSAYDPDLQQAMQDSMTSLKEAVHEEIAKVIHIVSKLRRRPGTTDEQDETDKMDKLAVTLRYWEILTEREIEAVGSIDIVTEWLLHARFSAVTTATTNDSPPVSPPPLTGSSSSGRRLGGKASSAGYIPDQLAKKKGAEAAEARLAADRQKNKISIDFIKKYQQPETQLPRNKLLPHLSPRTPKSRSTKAQSQSGKTSEARSGATLTQSPSPGDGADTLLSSGTMAETTIQIEDVSDADEELGKEDEGGNGSNVRAKANKDHEKGQDSKGKGWAW